MIACFSFDRAKPCTFSFMKMDKNKHDCLFFITLPIFGGEAMHKWSYMKMRLAINQ